jgi:hypothetical protein
MKICIKLLVLLGAIAFVLASVPAQAVTYNFNYRGAGPIVAGDPAEKILGYLTDGSGKTSPYAVDASNKPLSPFYAIETFDSPDTTTNRVIQNNGHNIVISAGGGFTSLNPATDLKIEQGSIGIRKGSVGGLAAMPAGDDTFYAYAPGPTNITPGSTGFGLGAQPTGSRDAKLRVEYKQDFAPGGKYEGLYISYLGLYYGSIDRYNDLTFYNSNGDKVIGTGLMSDGVISGGELIDAHIGTTSGCSAGDQRAACTNLYVNLFFDPSERFTSFVMSTKESALGSGIAFETDNIAIGLRVAPVPEPTSMLLLGLGLLGLAGIKRKFNS